MYISIDLETTGLDHDLHQVLEIGAVIDVPDLHIMECPSFQTEVKHDTIVGDMVALAMNAELIQRISERWDSIPYENVASQHFTSWLLIKLMELGMLDEFDRPKSEINIIGKNFGKHDYWFLENMDGFDINLIGHRFADLSGMLADRHRCPSTSKLAEMFPVPEWLEGTGKLHNALYDARYQLHVAREHWKILADAGLM